MQPAKSFKDLIVWQKSHDLVLNIYQLSSTFPKEEIYGLTSQIRRAVISIAGNIAEGFTKRGLKDKMRFLNISEGSLEEVKYYLLLSKDLGYTIEELFLNETAEVGKLLSGYIKSLKS